MRTSYDVHEQTNLWNRLTGDFICVVPEHVGMCAIDISMFFTIVKIDVLCLSLCIFIGIMKCSFFNVVVDWSFVLFYNHLISWLRQSLYEICPTPIENLLFVETLYLGSPVSKKATKISNKK